MQVVQQFTNPHMYIRLGSLPIELGSRIVGCAAHLAVQVCGFDRQDARPVNSRKKIDTILICEAGQIFSGRASRMGGQLDENLERQIKHCLGQMNY